MRSLILAFVSTLTASMAAWAQPATGSEPIVGVGLFGYNVEGKPTSAAWDNEPSLSSIVYANATLCSVGAGHRTPPPDARHAWKFSGSIVSKTADEVVLQLQWQRLLDRGQPVSGAEHTVQLTLRNGERVALDSVIPEPSACSSATAAFEARYGPRMAAMWGTSPTASPRAAAGRQTPGNGTSPTQTSPMQVDLWLVHSAPGQPEAAFHQPVRPQDNEAKFAFPPVPITTPSGTAMVQVDGSFIVSSSRQLIFFTSRRVSHSGQPEAVSTGKIVRDLPSAEEVLSFDMPPIRAAGSKTTLPDQFSVRFRLSNGKK